jgi:hypothetical protein
MIKSLLRNEQEYKNLKDAYSENGKINWWVGTPDMYPCLAMFETRTSDNGWDYFDGDFAYITDFENLVTANDEIPMENQ